MKLFNKLSLLLCLFIILLSCDEGKSRKSTSSPAESKFYDGIGVGPVTKISLVDGIDSTMVVEGEKVFRAKCITCHVITDERRIGPGLLGITQRRRPEWIMNQILNPLEMTKKDSLSKELLSIYLSQMTDMNISHDEARSLLEYFRKNDSASK